MIAFVGRRDFRGSLPQSLASRAIETEDLEAVLDLWSSISSSLSTGLTLIAGRWCFGRFANRNGSGNENPIAPDGWR